MLSASYEVDFWGKNRFASLAAQETAVASRFAKEVVVISTVASVGSWSSPSTSAPLLTLLSKYSQQNAAAIMLGGMLDESDDAEDAVEAVAAKAGRGEFFAVPGLLGKTSRVAAQVERFRSAQ